MSLPLIVAGSSYHCGVGSPGMGPYFHNRVPGGTAVGSVQVKLAVKPGVQPVTVNDTSPWVNSWSGGALPAGGDRGSPSSGM